MKKVIKDTSVYFNGQSQTILAGTEYADNAPLVVKYPKAFADSVVEKAPKKVEVIEEPKEELLVEAPVAELKVEVIEEPKVEEKPAKKARKRKTKDHDGDVV